MAKQKLKSLDDYNHELRARLHRLRDRYQQIDIARRTGVPAPNVHRYMRSGKIPAEFCLALVDAFELSPDWLMRGEGDPVTSDVKASTAAKAGELLDLVKTMNAVARMRLGAVVGDRDRKKLRELSETLETFDRLRERMNENTRPVLSQLLEDLAEALAKLEIPRARVLRETAVELSRLCTDEAILERLDSLQSGVEYMTGRPDQALEYERRVFARRVRDGRLAGGDGLSLVMTLRDTGRIEEARRVCGAILSLLGDARENLPAVFEMRMFMGNFHVELGNMREGIVLLQECYPQIPPERRIAATILLVRGQVLAGLMGYHEAFHFGVRTSGSARLLLRLACFREDTELLEHASKNLLGRGVHDVPPDEYDSQRAALLLRASAGKSKASDFDRMVEKHPPVVATQAMRRLMLAVHGGQFARIASDKKALRSKVSETQAAFEALPPDLYPRCEFKVIHLRNMAALGKSKAWQEPAKALHNELQQWINNGYLGLGPLPDLPS
ncbi:MAG: hypothetical protein KDB32_00960 [Planctomycetes bacterium]|nr:hypothetical protein [Planctomycetota bacterium]